RGRSSLPVVQCPTCSTTLEQDSNGSKPRTGSEAKHFRRELVFECIQRVVAYAEQAEVGQTRIQRRNFQRCQREMFSPVQFCAIKRIEPTRNALCKCGIAIPG